MTVSTKNNGMFHVGNGSTLVFPFDFQVLNYSHVDVYLDELLQGSGFTIQMNPDQHTTAGGTVVFDSPPFVNQTVAIIRNTPPTQEVDYAPFGPFPAETHEIALDKATILTQQLQHSIDRTLKYPDSSTNVNIGLPDPDPNFLLRWSGDASRLENVDADDIVDDVDPALIKELYESNANTNEFDDAEQEKLAGIENGATDDQTATEIKTAYESNSNTNEFNDGEKIKLENLPNPGPTELVPAAPITWDVDLPLRERLVRKLHGGLTFTRASTADYVNKSGITETAEIDEPAITADGMVIYEDEFIAGRAADIASIQMSGNMPPAGEPFSIVIDTAVPFSASNTYLLFSREGADTGTLFELRFAPDNSIQFVMGESGGSSFTARVNNRDDLLHRYILRYTGSITDISVDTVASNLTGQGVGNYAVNEPLYIGCTSADNGQPNTELRNFFIVHRALLDSEIYALGRADGLIPYLPFKPADLGTPDIIATTDSPTEISIDFDVVDGATDYVIRITPA